MINYKSDKLISNFSEGFIFKGIFQQIGKFAFFQETVCFSTELMSGSVPLSLAKDRKQRETDSLALSKFKKRPSTLPELTD